MNMTNWIAQTIQRKDVAAIPIMTHPGIELNGRTVKEAVCNGTVHYDAVMTLCEKYNSADAATIIDLTTEA